MKDWHHGRGKWCFFKPTKSWNAQTVPFYAVHFVPILTPFSDVKRPYYPVKCILHTTQPRRNFMRLERFKPSCVYGVPASGSLLNGRRWRLYTLSAQSGRKRSCHVYCAQLSFLCHTFFFFQTVHSFIGKNRGNFAPVTEGVRLLGCSDASGKCLLIVSTRCLNTTLFTSLDAL